MIGKVFHVELEASVRPERDELPHDEIVPPGFAVRSQPHHLVLRAVDPESEVVRKGRIEQSERVREMNRACQTDVGAASVSHCRRLPLPHTVNGQDGSFFKRRDKEGACRMSDVMIGKQDLPLIPQLPLDGLRDPHLLLQPNRERLQIGTITKGKRSERCEENPFKLDKGLVIEGHRVEVGDGNTRLPETGMNGVRRKPGIVASPGKPFLLGRCNQPSVLYQRRRSVVVEARDPEDVHRQNCLLLCSRVGSTGSFAFQ